jgi:predicted GIY-YIG superfamily endonuclease
MPLPYCVYILQSLRDGNLYTGYTTDLDQRLCAVSVSRGFVWVLDNMRGNGLILIRNQIN